MGMFAVLNEAQSALCRECGIDPEGFLVILDNDRCLMLLHLKSRNEVMIQKNRRGAHGGA